MRKILLCLCVALLPLWGNNAQAMQNVASPEGRVVVIDAGHGGSTRPGAVVGSVMEKDLNLSVALQVEQLLKQKMPELEVLLTRTTDVQLHSSKESDNLQRPKLANSEDADLFVSIHANALENKDVAGAEVIVLSLDGATQGHTQRRTTVSKDNEDYIHIDNIDKTSLAYIEALSLLMNNDPINRTFGEIVGNKFRSIGRRFRGVKVYPEKVWTVLYPLRMPGVIVEMGFMTNSSELKYMTSASGQKAIATAISDAIVEYFKRLEQMTIKDVATDTPAPVADSNAKKTTENDTSIDTSTKDINEGYTIQLMASSEQLPTTSSRFAELSNDVFEFLGEGAYKYKYCYGKFTTLSDAKAQIEHVRKSFSDAYIVQFKGKELK